MRSGLAGVTRAAGARAAANSSGGFYARPVHRRRRASGRMKRERFKVAPRPAQTTTSAPPAIGQLAARRAALQILLRVERDRAFADVLLGHRLAGFAAADRRLI